MIDPTVRTAVGDDAAQIADLEREARTALQGQRGGERWLATHTEIGDAWTEVIDAEIVLVAEIDRVAVGYAHANIEGDVARVQQVYVTPGARELGFGDEMLAGILARARSLGSRLLEGEALPGDRDTKNLYERAGITARLITVSTRLD